jgi:chromate transporter
LRSVVLQDWFCAATFLKLNASNLLVPTSGRASFAALAAFVALLIGLPLIASALGTKWIDLFSAFYRSGALVFGGGHVVLPLLHDAFIAPGWVSDEAFLAGYGAAQAVPGPLFTFAVYLGSIAVPSHRLLGAA